jgi:hypothetical protein
METVRCSPDFERLDCFAKEVVQRPDGETVEILQSCNAGSSIKFSRRAAPRPIELVL